MTDNSRIKCLTNKAIVDHTSSALCTPITTFQADPFCSERVSHVILLFTFSPKIACPFSFGDRIPYLTVTRGTYGLPESLFQTASRSVQPFLYGSQMTCCTMHCQRRRTPQTAPSPWDFATLPEDRARATDHMRVWFRRYRRRQRDTQPDVLITILRHRSRGRSK